LFLCVFHQWIYIRPNAIFEYQLCLYNEKHIAVISDFLLTAFAAIMQAEKPNPNKRVNQ
jgi:hypothetical protein